MGRKQAIAQARGFPFAGDAASLRPYPSGSFNYSGKAAMGHATFRVGDLEAVIGDNEACGQHQAGYNGIWSLRHTSGTRSLFVPEFAGLNLEHIFDGEIDDSPAVRFEPRRAPMTLRKLSVAEAELHQPPTPTFHLESWTHFTFVEPHIIDFRYRCVAHEPAFRHGYVGLFWASYIHAPEDKSLHFLGYPARGGDSVWCQLCTLHHRGENTIRHRDDEFDAPCRDGYGRGSLRNLSPVRYDLPLCYGLFEEHVWLLMFDRTDGIRFTHNPYGGNGDVQRRSTNPAWDFQFLIPNYEVGEEYGFSARALFRPRCSREEILEEYQRWRPTLPGESSVRMAP